MIDGQPIGDQIGITFSNSLDPAVAENLEIITGGIPAEYGEKANGVINLTTRSGLGYERRQGGRLGRGGAVLDGFGDRLRRRREQPVRLVRDAWTPRPSDRFLDPVSFDNFHNHGQTRSAASSGSTPSRRTSRATGA